MSVVLFGSCCCCCLVLLAQVVSAERPLRSSGDATVADVVREEVVEEPFVARFVEPLLRLYTHVWPVRAVSLFLSLARARSRSVCGLSGVCL